MKGFSFLLLAAILQTSVCSVMCASGLYSCCGEMKVSSGTPMKPCCAKKHKGEKQSSGCEKEHYAFFKAVGQYHTHAFEVLTKVFQPSISIPYSSLLFHTINSQSNFIAYHCFHPPPLLDDVCILNSSFRI